MIEVIGGVFIIAAFLWLVLLAFRTGIGWGLASLFIPFVVLLYALLNLNETWKPLILLGVGLVMGWPLLK